MIEHPILLGRDGRLTGLVSLPGEAATDPTPVVVLFLNAGLIHRVGPNRMYVDMARHLAGRGFPSVRYDMSGIGDSDRSPVERSYVEQTVADITEAMDDLESRFGAKRFVLIGLCTGAYSALAAAPGDERVVGCVLIDGYAYPTRKYRLKNLVWKTSQPWRWKRYALRMLGLGTNERSTAVDATLVFQPEQLDRDSFERRIETLTKRGCRLHISYTRFGMQPYNYRNQFFDEFPDLDGEMVSLLYLAHADHTFALPVPRAELISSIGDWMGRHFTSQVPETRAS